MLASDDSITPDLVSLPAEILRDIAVQLVPSAGCASEPDAWQSAIRLSAVSRSMLQPVGDAIRQAIPAFGSLKVPSSIVAWSQLLARIYSGGNGQWARLRPLRAVRAQLKDMLPLQAAPSLSGASLCALAPGKLCVFGGRSSLSSETFDSTLMASVTFSSSRAGASQPPQGVATWDRLVFADDDVPPARCYHTAALWHDEFHQQRSASIRMVVFGGCSVGDRLLNDSWCLEGLMGAGDAPRLRWRELSFDAAVPSPRSSHVCATWSAENALVLHGGLGNEGVTSDVWVLRQSPKGSRNGPGTSQWVELMTAGGKVARAHHCGGIIGDGNRAALLIYSGQDANLLTVHGLARLTLSSATWEMISLPTDGPYMANGGSLAGGPSARIDAAATVVEGVGMLIFGGVGADFSFCAPDDAWLLRGDCSSPPKQRVVEAAAAQSEGSWKGPCSRACVGLCADGLGAYLFGGFDGEADTSDLWCLSLLPPAFREASPIALHSDFESAEFKARQARQASVIHATPGASGHSTLHGRVMRAARAEAHARGVEHPLWQPSSSLPPPPTTTTTTPPTTT